MPEINTPKETPKNYTAEFLVAGGYILFFCIAIYTLVVFYFLGGSTNQAKPVNVIATNLPSIYPTPSIDFEALREFEIILEDDFSEDQNLWESYNDKNAEVKIESGELYLKSLSETKYGVAECRTCLILGQPYFLQADLRPKDPNISNLGIKFNARGERNNFYVFLINSDTGQYYVSYHSNESGWTSRISGKSEQIKPFPETNTLGIFADANMVEFYINGMIVDTYTHIEKNFVLYKGYIGFFISGDPGQTVIIDNLLIQEVGK
ncbi:MAG: hypothetical protein J0M11_17165 [Anaerolineae bacterium]|nr:hypothetical protein [Anaerolineae bacterium]